MKFEISGFLRSEGLFQARGPGKVLPFHLPLSRVSTALTLFDIHFMVHLG